MPNVIVTGGPGAGKTTLLAELAASGYSTVEESARAIIAERRALGASPRPDPLAFAREILRRDIEKYRSHLCTLECVFFDRGLVEALGMLHAISPLPSNELETILESYPFHATVFVLPPWEAIYVNDAERDQSFAEAIDVYTRVVQWYRSCGYLVEEVPCLPVDLRADHVLYVLAGRAGIETGRLRLVPKTVDGVRAQIESMTAEQRSELSLAWLARLDSATVDHWTVGFDIVSRRTEKAVGTCGFKGPPGSDEIVEIAYGVDSAYRGRGYATEAASALVTYAFRSGRVRRVRAHTLAAGNASARVLTKCGFRAVGEVIDPEDGVVSRWEIERDPSGSAYHMSGIG